MNAADVKVVTEIAARVSRETMRLAQRGGLSTPVHRPATVADFDSLNATVTVLVDGDASTIPALNAMPVVPPVGSRVLVLFEPPNGVFVIGRIGSLDVAVPHSQTILNDTVNTSTNSTSFIAVSGVPAMTFTKRFDSSYLQLDIAMNAIYGTTGSVGMHGQFALRINAADIMCIDEAFSQLDVRASCAGMNQVLTAAATYTIELTYRNAGIAGWVAVDSESTAMFRVTEMFL